MGIIISLFSISIVIFLFFRFRPPAAIFSGNCSPPTYPLIGCLLSFYKNRNRLLDWYTELLSESATGTIVVRRLGCRRTVVTANPVNVEYILTTHFVNFPKGKAFTEILGDFLGCGIFNVDGELWRTQRKLASHEFSAKSLQEFVVKTLESEVEMRLLPAIESSARDNVVVNLQELLREFAFSVICKVVLGSEEEAISALEKSFDVASEVSAGRAKEPVYVIWKMKRWLGVGSERRLRMAVAEVHRKVMNIIDKRKKKKKKAQNFHDSEDLLSRLISIGHDDEVIRDMAISFIMAGRDTTSAAMTWLFWLLSHHPIIENQLVEEINSESTLSPQKQFDYKSLKKLKFLKACLCETMRIYPPVPWDSKHAIVNDYLPDGTPVQAGDRVTYFPYGMGRMEALWGEDRFEFKPSRWLLEPDGLGRRREKLVSPYKFPIFQAGPRVCLGKEMAFIQMKYVVASILSQFRIKPIAADDPVFVPLLTAHMAGGFKVLFQRREKERGERESQFNTNKIPNLNNQMKSQVSDSNTELTDNSVEKHTPHVSTADCMNPETKNTRQNQKSY